MTDFFTPIVDDPFDFGRIAATNALSDVYAMGATPIFCLAIVGMPVNALPRETVRLILEGGRAVAEAAGAPVGLRLSLAEDSPPALEGAPRPAFEDRPPLLTPPPRPS